MAWRVFGGSVGKDEQNNQDCFVTVSLAPDVCGLIVADGAGSAALGGKGAKIACAAMEKWLKTHWKHVVNDVALYEKAVEAVVHALKKQPKPLENYATTLLSVVCSPSGMVCCQVGDGFIVSASQDAYQRLLPGQHGEHVNETLFVTTPHVRPQWTHYPFSPFIALGSDGVERLAIDHQGPSAKFFQPFDQYVSQVEDSKDDQVRAFLESADFQKRMTDDSTLVMAAWKQ